jgi:hypothetical protein
MTPRLEPRIARQAEVDTQCRHCSGGGACLLSGHQLPNHESPSLTSSTGGEVSAQMKELWTSDIRTAFVKFSEFPVIPCSALTFWSCKLFWTRLHAVNRAWPSSLHQVFPVFFPVPRESGSHETGSTAIHLESTTYGVGYTRGYRNRKVIIGTSCS